MTTPSRSFAGSLALAAATVTVLAAGPIACGGESGPAQAKKSDAKAGDAKAGDAKAGDAKAAPKVSAAAVLEKSKNFFQPLPTEAKSDKYALNDDIVALGKALYFDPRLSVDGDMSCNTCHDVQNFGVDVREVDGARARTSLGHGGKPGARNSPTVFNAAIQFVQFWDGRAADVEEQAKGPVLNPDEMAMPDAAAVEKVLAGIPEYAPLFDKAFPTAEKKLSFDNVALAIAAYERRLMTPSKFDAFLNGDLAALDQKQLLGLQTYMDVGCTTCHTGSGLGGTMFQKLGSVKPYETADMGRFEVTKQEADKKVFKVPVLRNITKTGPYLHDGSLATLEETVQMMAEYQLARGKLEPAELEAIVAFLGALEATPPAELITPPELPGKAG